MPFSPVSFVFGIAVASVLPAVARVFRPFAVEAAAAGMGVVEDTRRIMAEQIEALEDIVAEARARREHHDAEAMSALDEIGDEAADEPVSAGRGRRRANGTARRRPS